ncbi:MAG: hypothetical protein JXL97_11300 [Bacteroidales bacterium]|nr:hypothetical protein [Bacteroidales bacterium]
MFIFNKISDLLSTLHKEGKLIDIIFGTQRKSIKYDDLLNYDYEPQRIDELLQKNILIKSGSYIELNSDLRDFFEKFTDNYKEINTDYTTGIIRDIRENLEYFTNETKSEKKQDYLNKIKRNLRNIGTDILRNINNIRNYHENEIITEQNFRITKIKLENLDKRKKEVDTLINELKNLLREDSLDFFVKTSNDSDMLNIITDLHKKLSVAQKNWIDITQKILVYINQIKLQSELTKKIIELKKLKDELVLRSSSDFEKVIGNEISLFFQPELRYSTKLSISNLQTDEGLEIIEKVNKKKKRKLLLISEDNNPIEEDFFDAKSEEKQIINLQKLQLAFNSQSKNLFDFLIDYNFNSELSVNEKITLFCQFASQFSDEIQFTDKYSTFINSNKEISSFNSIEYAVILPK